MENLKLIRAIEKMERIVSKANLTISEGIEEVIKFVYACEEKDEALRALAEREVTEEKILAFMGRSMLPYDEARRLLQEALYQSYLDMEEGEENE